ncbi:MAG: DNA-directed RNA polymerase subunit beta [Vibrionaceae bacterium]|nr:DNA-directed RNA polymerase subunit beta [Vibrionaceae bacterium]
MYKPFSISLMSFVFSTHSFAQSSDLIAQYLQEQNQQSSYHDHYAQPVVVQLDTEEKPRGVTWREDGKPDHCQYVKNRSSATSNFDYGEANDLSDGLHHFDLPPVHSPNVKVSHRVYASSPNLLPGNQQFSTPSEGSISLSISSDCFD